MIQNDYIYLYSVELEEVEGLETIILAFAWKYDYSTKFAPRKNGLSRS